MRKALIAVFASLVTLTILFPSLVAPGLRAQNKPAAKPMKLKVGDMAPDFTLLSFDGKDVKKVSLSDYRGKKNVALAFYVFAFTGG
jgi:cytochrome oxidase Cu insertion factor (SCO1/SenC/PrrC family)